MAQKKISDLTLISAMADDVNLPGENATQTYRLTGAQLKAYILATASIDNTMLAPSAIHSQTADTAPQTVDEILTWDSSATALKRVTVANARKKPYRTITTTDTLTAEDSVIFCSAASGYTLNLPTAVGIGGKEYWILRTSTAMANVVSVDPDGSETIGGAATFGLTTAGEMLHIVSDNANWQVLEHRSSLGPYTETLTISAGFGTTTLQSTWFTRRGKMLYCHGYFKTGTTAGSEASIQLPSGYLIDTAALTSTGSVQIVGRYRAIRTSGTPGVGFKEELFYDGSTNNKLFFAGVNSNSNILGKSNGSDNFNTNDGCTFHFEIPIAAWPA